MFFNDIQKVYELAVAYIGNGRYFAFAMASLLFLFVTSKKIRPRLIYPTLLVLVLISTPWLYHYVFNRDAYWRTFWMFPGSVLIALFCVRLIQACGNVGERVGMTVFLMALLFFMGTNMYLAERTRPDGTKEPILTEASNPEKISEGTKQIADILLAIEDHPRVIPRKKYVYELRQYSSDIELYYGRDIDGFIIPIAEKKGWRYLIHEQLESSSPNYYRVLSMADKAGYNFVLTSAVYRIDEKILDQYGYRECAILDGSAVYYKENPTGSGEEAETAESQDAAAEAAEATEAAAAEAAASGTEVPETSTESSPEAAEDAPQENPETEVSENADGEGPSEEGNHTDGTELLEEFAENS